MTTILADTRLGVMVSDSHFGDGDTKGRMRKVWRVNRSLVGLAGNLDEMVPFLLWLKSGSPEKGPRIPNLSALLLQPSGLLWFIGSAAPIIVQRHYEAIGSGGGAAKAAHQALDFKDPKKAVRIACDHDAGSAGPVRVYKL